MKTIVKSPAKATQAQAKEQVPIVTTLGFVAGDVWKYLDEHGEASLKDLQTQLKQTPAMLQMAVGWLAGEQKLSITKQGAGYLIRLNH